MICGSGFPVRSAVDTMPASAGQRVSVCYLWSGSESLFVLTDHSENVALEIRIEEARPAQKCAGPRRLEMLDHRHEVGKEICDLPALVSETIVVSQKTVCSTYSCKSRIF